MSNGIAEIRQSLDAIKGQVDQMAREFDVLRSAQWSGNSLQKASIAGYHLRPETIGAGLELDADEALQVNEATVDHGGLAGLTDDDHVAYMRMARTGDIAGLSEKTAPVAADLAVIDDSAASNAKKKVQLGNLPYTAKILVANSVVTANMTGSGFRTMYSWTVPANTLGVSNKILRITVAYRRTSGSSQLTTMRFTYGGTSVAARSSVSSTPGTITCYLMNTGATNAQRGFLEAVASTGTAAVDSTQDQTLTFEIDLATDGDVWVGDMFLVELLQ